MTYQDLQEAAEHGVDAGRGNLLGIQPFLNREDYASEEAFASRLDSYFQDAHQRGWIGERTVAVLPEHIGTWLALAGEDKAVYQVSTIDAAARLLARKHLVGLARNWLSAKEGDRLSASLFRVMSVKMARIYQSVFARLAQTYQITIAAGSIVLPAPTVREGIIGTGRGELYNTAFVFRPDGRAEGAFARKIYPIESELPFTQPGLVKNLPVWDTPAGRLGILVCADSWYPEPYEQLKTQQVELIAVPSAFSPGEDWYKPWDGYNGAPEPADVDKDDIGRLTEGQAWQKYSLASRMAASGARYGINLFLYGDLWDLAFTGGRWKIISGETVIAGKHDGAALINLWL